MGEMDEIGGIVTGGLLARAVEPGAGEPGANGHSRETACLNCATPLTGPYCGTCGQKAHVHRSLRAFFSDFVAGLFNFEGKIWRTLPMLAWRPGEMTRRYIDGQRARFVSPAALYLFSVFAMFAVLNFTGMTDSDGTTVRTGISEAAAEQRASIGKLEAERGQRIAAKAGTTAIDLRLAQMRKELDELDRLQRGEVVAIGGLEQDGTPPWLRDVVAKAQKDPAGTIVDIQDAASKYSWLLIPLSVPFLWLLFPFSRRFRLYDHSVFVTYSLSFMMALVILGGLLVASGASGLASLLILLPPFHMYRHLKGGYLLSRTGALLRTVALVTFAMVAGVIFFVAIFAIGLL